MPLNEWLSFLLIALTITVSPGPGGLLTLALGATRGPRAALISAAGLVAGGLYLFKLAVDSWLMSGALSSQSKAGSASLATLFSTGAMVSLSNAKLIALLAALLPTFAGPEPSLIRSTILAISYAAVAYFWHGALALTGKALGASLASTRGLRIFRRLVACIFVVFGAGFVVEVGKELL